MGTDVASSFDTSPDAVIFQLACLASPPVKPSVLGHMECVIKRPDGIIEVSAGDEITPAGVVPVSPELPEAPAAYFWDSLRGISGRYEVRWYGTERRPYEIARKTFDIELTSMGNAESQPLIGE
jgi:hypothetical protein